jgi:hypothetical protein
VGRSARPRPTGGEVIAWLAQAAGTSASAISPETRLREDLNIQSKAALALIAEFGARFGVNTDRLNRNFVRHYGPRGFGWWDWQLNYLTLGALAVLGAGVLGLIPRWSLPLGGLVVASAAAVGWWRKLRVEPLIPLTVDDFTQAAAAGRWMRIYPVSWRYPGSERPRPL